MPDTPKPLTDAQLYALGFTRVLLLNQGEAFRADYEGYQVVGWPIVDGIGWREAVPENIANILAPRRTVAEGGTGGRDWTRLDPAVNVAPDHEYVFRLADLHATPAERIAIGTTINPATGENTYERSDAETMAHYQRDTSGEGDATSAELYGTASTGNVADAPLAPVVKAGQRVLVRWSGGLDVSTVEYVTPLGNMRLTSGSWIEPSAVVEVLPSEGAP